MANDKITFRCRRCGGDQFVLPSATPKPADVVSCSRCGASARYGDLQAEAVKLATQHVGRAFQDAFKDVKSIKLKLG